MAPSVRELSAMLTEGVITFGQDSNSEAERGRYIYNFGLSHSEAFHNLNCKFMLTKSALCGKLRGELPPALRATSLSEGGLYLLYKLYINCGYYGQNTNCIKEMLDFSGIKCYNLIVV